MSLTCISCKLLFSIPQLHQEHYKTDWHRYNLKRRLAELPPLTKEEFDKRAAAFKEDAEGKLSKVPMHCQSCNKYFSSKNAWANHLKSKKHIETEAGVPKKPKKIKSHTKPAGEPVKKVSNPVNVSEDSDEEWSDDGEEGDWESCDDSENEGEMTRIVIDTDDCLFCDHHSDSTVDNVSHMTLAHSFFIPDVEYLSNLDGLIAALACKIHLDRVCLWCNGKGKGFRNVKSVKQHMFDKGHCKMLHEGDALLDYADFYDYSSVEEAKEVADVAAIDAMLDESDYELILPSGATVGHRSLAIYYKQNLKPVSSDSQTKVKKVLQHYKALGYTGATGEASVRKARDISYMQKIRSRHSLKLGVKNNKLQPHFRQQVMF